MLATWHVVILLAAWMTPTLVQEEDSSEKLVLDLGGGIRMEFARIKAGKFMMGSENGDPDEKPVHEVTITKDFWMQTTETTQAQWEAVMGTNPSHFKGADLPVESVSWEDCQVFLKKLNAKTTAQLKGKKATLPTESEWEYACRAGSTTQWCFGNDGEKLGEYAWCWKNLDEKTHQTHPVGRKKPNAWGLYDMHGNVSEWTQDRDGPYEKDALSDPTGPAKGDAWCIRGGSWLPSDSTRSARRVSSDPTCRSSGRGFRASLR